MQEQNYANQFIRFIISATYSEIPSTTYEILSTSESKKLTNIISVAITETSSTSEFNKVS